ncbi:unnamed protein product [Lota lota]
MKDAPDLLQLNLLPRGMGNRWDLSWEDQSHIPADVKPLLQPIETFQSPNLLQRRLQASANGLRVEHNSTPTIRHLVQPSTKGHGSTGGPRGPCSGPGLEDPCAAAMPLSLSSRRGAGRSCGFSDESRSGL